MTKLEKIEESGQNPITQSCTFGTHFSLNPENFFSTLSTDHLQKPLMCFFPQVLCQTLSRTPAKNAAKNSKRVRTRSSSICWKRGRRCSASWKRNTTHLEFTGNDTKKQHRKRELTFLNKLNKDFLQSFINANI